MANIRTQVTKKTGRMGTVTLKDVAKRAGVAKGTASVVLSGVQSALRVSDETRARVQQAATDLSYHPNAVARGLSQGRMFTLGVLFSGFEVIVLNNYYATGIMQGVMWAAAAADYDVLLFTKGAEDRGASSVVRDRRTDGFLVVAPVIDSPAIALLAAQGLPLIAVGSGAHNREIPSVDVDNAEGARLAAEHLLSLGHKRIAHITGSSSQYAVAERYQSYKRTLEGAGVSVSPEFVMFVDFLGDSHYRAARELLTRPDPPTAILAGGDMIALAIMEAARDLGISVPKQLSVVGFDDIVAAPLVTPPLTTIRQPLMEIGDRATQLLLALITGESVAPTARLLTPELIVRASTAPCR